MQQAVFYSPEGSEYRLARALSRELGSPVAVMSASPTTRMSSIRIGYKRGDKRGLLKSLARKIAADPITEPACGVGSSSWPEWFFFIAQRTSIRSEMKEFDFVVENQGDRISVRTSNGPVRLDRLLARLPGKPSCHWYYADAYVACEMDNVTTSLALQTVAKAVGARLEKSGPSLSIDLDPKTYRSRAVGLLSTLSRQGPTTFRVDYEFSGEVLQWLKDDQVSSCLANPTQEEEYAAEEAKGIQEVAARRLRRRYPVRPEDRFEYSSSAIQAWKQMKSWADWSIAYKVSYSASGWARAVYKGRTGHGDGHI